MPKPLARAHRRGSQPRIKGSPAGGVIACEDLSRTDTITPANAVHAGELVVLRRIKPRQVLMETVSRKTALMIEGPVYRIQPGKRRQPLQALLQAVTLTRCEKRPGFSFGDFAFHKFQNWLLQRYQCFVSAMDMSIEEMQENCDQDDALMQALLGKSRSIVCDYQYLSLLGAAVFYSVSMQIEEVGRDFVSEAFRRARYMLIYHANHLPVRIDDENIRMVDYRARIVAGVLIPVYIQGFESKASPVVQARRQFPDALIKAWKANEHADHPLSQYMATTFWFAFRTLAKEVPRSWPTLVDRFWPLWIEHLLDVAYALVKGDLEVQ